MPPHIPNDHNGYDDISTTESTFGNVMQASRYAIEMNIGGAWERLPEDGTYTTHEEAEQKIKDHITDCINAVEGGDLEDSPDPSDFRVVEAA